MADDTVVVNFALLHPEFTTDVGEGGLRFWMNPDQEHDWSFDLHNSGNGTLVYESCFNYILDAGEERDDPDEIWDPLLLWNASDSTAAMLDLIPDRRINGICYVKDKWYLSGSNNSEDNNYFYIFDNSGHLLDTLSQPLSDGNGFAEIAYHDDRLYCVVSSGYGNEGLWVLDPETADSMGFYPWTNPRMISSRNITIDPDSGFFYISTITSYIFTVNIVDDTLRTLRSFRPVDPRDGANIRMYGLAWFKDDPDNYPLYIISDKDIDEDPNKPDISIFKADPNTGDVRFLTDLAFLDPLSRGRCGICITSKWNNMVWVFASVFDNVDGDQVGIFELGPNASWLSYEPRSDTLFANERQDIQLHLNTADMDTGRYGVILEFTHNAIEHITSIPVTLWVTYDYSGPESDAMPKEFGLDQNYPNPFNAETLFRYSLPVYLDVNLTIFDLNGRRVKTLINTSMKAGYYTMIWDGRNENGIPVSSGLYFYRINAGNFTKVRKMTLIK